jgi:hypothetical protein
MNEALKAVVLVAVGIGAGMSTQVWLKGRLLGEVPGVPLRPELERMLEGMRGGGEGGVDERLHALHSLTRRALDHGTPGGLYAATAYHLAARAVRKNAALTSGEAVPFNGVVGGKVDP